MVFARTNLCLKLQNKESKKIFSFVRLKSGVSQPDGCGVVKEVVVFFSNSPKQVKF